MSNVSTVEVYQRSSEGMSRRKGAYDSTGKVAHERFCKEHPDIQLGPKQRAAIIKQFNVNLLKYALETGEHTKIGGAFGSIVVSKKKIKRYIQKDGVQYIGLPVDWKRTKELGKYVYNLNAHTDGCSFKWLWNRLESRFQHSSLWVFTPSRFASRLIAHYIKEGFHQLYREWERPRK